MLDSPTNLFDRVSERLFRPLGAIEHTRRNWALISHVYNDFFAPEADPPEGEGWTQRRVTASIERFLQHWDDHYGANPDELASPLNIRANGALKVLVDSEWLSMDRIGFTQYVIMKPTVQSLFELLNTFAEQGPEFISGRVQSIRNNLVQVKADPVANAAVFQLAGKECAALLRMLNTTRMRVREASEMLRQQEATHVFLQSFFGEYISGLYIGDYADLFSRNHPLASRWEIIDLVLQIADDPDSREKLRDWYRKNFHCRNNEEADQLVDADAARVLALRDVDRLLTRLKEAVTRANDQALGYLEYKVRAHGNFDLWIDQTIEAVVRTADSLDDQDVEMPTGWSQGRLLNEDSLKPVAVKPKKRQGAIIQKRELTPEEQARRLVRRIMKGNREVSESRIIDYIKRHIPPGGELESSEMQVESINDLCVLATFSRLGLVVEREQRNSRNGVKRALPYRGLKEHLVIELTGARFENEYLEAPAVRVRRVQPEKPRHAH
jgi:hypothetical protein